MFNIILDGEVVETVHYDNPSDVIRYVREEYIDNGLRPIIKEVK